MNGEAETIGRRELMAAWQQLHTSGTASPASAHLLRIGLEPSLASFSARFLGFGPLLILLDEAETAVERAGTRKQEEFLKFVRFLNDHVANPEVGGAAVVVIACTDEFWPEQFVKHTALMQRLSDAGRDSLSDRMNLPPAVLARLNKLWVRETFRGEREDYEKLGEALVDFATRLYPEVDRGVQLVNASLLAEAASSGAATRQVKRPFVKALAQTLEEQLSVGTQVWLSEDEAARLLDVTRGGFLDEDGEIDREIDREMGGEVDRDR